MSALNFPISLVVHEARSGGAPARDLRRGELAAPTTGKAARGCKRLHQARGTARPPQPPCHALARCRRVGFLMLAGLGDWLPRADGFVIGSYAGLFVGYY